jgi:hypothetical protein
MLLLCAVVVLALVCLQLTAAASTAWRERKNLTQHTALLERRIDSLEQVTRERFAPGETAPGNAVQDLTGKNRV